MKSLLFIFLLFFSSLLAAQNPEHFKWLIGSWKGPGFGGVMEEVWSVPDMEGKMMGMFRHYSNEGEMKFYEFWILDETGLKPRHFNPDMSAWEEKDDWIHFEMVETTPDKITLKGLVYERLEENRMKIYLTMNYGGEIKTEVFDMRREVSENDQPEEEDDQ